MFNSLYHAEIGGGYTLRRKITINAADLRPLGGQIEVAAITENGDELNSQRQMLEDAKTANAYYRKHKTLEGCPGLSEKTRAWLTRPGVFASGDGSPISLYGSPFPAYELDSIRGKIERTEQRLAELDRREQQAAESQTGTAFDGGQIVRNIDLNRLQILFDAIPSADTRAALKQNGFHWSPKNQAWQRQLTDNAERAARQVLSLA